MAKILITSDLHLTSKPEDSYRFGLFKWIREKVIQEHDIEHVFVLGDVTDAKDRHPAELVLRVVNEFVDLERMLPGSVAILQGNHDYYTRQDLGFFSFMSYLRGSIYWYDHPASCLWNQAILDFIPFIRDPEKQEMEIRESRHPEPKSQVNNYLFLHHTFNNALASNGQKMRGGMSSVHPSLKRYDRVFSGDIHVPQTLGEVIYVGSPYTIRFNDAFDPRLIVLDIESNEMYDVYYPCIKRHTVDVGVGEDFSSVVVREGDQVKVKLKVPRSSIKDIPDMKRKIVMQMDKIGAHLHGIQTNILPVVGEKQYMGPRKSDQELASEVIKRYGEREKFSQEMIEAGIRLADGNYLLEQREGKS